MPRLRTLRDTGEAAPGLRGPALRARRLHELLDGRRLEDDSCWSPSGAPPRYVVIQEYADAGRGCGQWVEQGDDLAAVLRVDAERRWIPVELHDLDQGRRWRIEMAPLIVGAPRPPEMLDRANAELRELAAECEYDPHGESRIAALIEYKNAVEDRLRAALAAGWSA